MVGKPYARAVRLYAIAVDNWAALDGSFPAVEIATLPSYKFLNVVFRWCLDRIEPDKLEGWIAMLNEPLPWAVDRGPSPEQLEREGADFMAFMNQINGG